MTTSRALPAGIVWQEEPRLPILGDAYAVWQAGYEILQSMGLLAAPGAVTLSTGSADLVNGLSVLSAESGDTDTLEFIDLASVADGRVVMLAAAAGHTITVAHLAPGISNAGEIHLMAGADLVLDTAEEFVWLQRRGTAFRQISPVTLGRVARLYQDLDMSGFAAFGGAYKIEEHSLSSRPVTVADRGKQIVNLVSCDNVLPLAQPASGAQWKKGDRVLFRQEAASCVFKTSAGGVPRNLDNHDRGRGIGAKIEAELIRVTPGFLWAIGGQTMAAPGGGTISRVYQHLLSTSTILTDAGSTAWKNALALVHTPGSSEKWLYLAHCGFKASGNQAQALAEMRFQRAAAGTGPQFGCGRYTQESETTVMAVGVEYGASPGSQTINLDLKSGSASYTAQCGQPRIFGLRLETDEYLELAAGAANNMTNTSYVDLVTMTHTLPADDYYILAWATTDTVNNLGLTMCLDIDGGTIRQEKNMARHTGLKGYYFVLQPWTFTAASHTIKLKGKSAGSFNSSGLDMGICLLRKSRFQQAVSVNDGTTTTTTSATPSDKVTLSQALLGGWDYLALGDIDTALSNDAAAAGAVAQMVMNGAAVGRPGRQVGRLADSYIPVSQAFMGLVQQQQPTDVFAVQYASQNGADTVTGKEASILLLALAAP